MRILEKAHRPKQHFENIRLQMPFQILPVLPLSKKTEFILIFCADTKLTASAPILRPYRTYQRSERL